MKFIKLLIILFSAFLLFLLVLLAIWLVLRDADLGFFSTEGVTRANWLVFIGGYIGAFATFSLGLVAINQSKVSSNQNDRLLFLEECNRMPVLTVTKDDPVIINEHEGYVELSFRLSNSGKSPITELRVLNETHNLNKDIIESSLQNTQYLQQQNQENLKLSESLNRFGACGDDAILSNLTQIKDFLLRLSPNSEDKDIHELDLDKMVFDLTVDNVQEWTKDQGTIHISNINAISSLLQSALEQMRQLEGENIKIQKRLMEHAKMYESLRSLHDFGEFLSNDFCFIGIDESVPRSIKVPIYLREKKDLGFSLSRELENEFSIHGITKDKASVWGAKIFFEFKNLYGAWYKEELNVDIWDNKIKASALTVNLLPNDKQRKPNNRKGPSCVKS